MIFSGTITFMVIVIIAVIKIYSLTLIDSKKNHQLQQMEMAKATGNGIRIYLDHLVEDMRLLTNFEGIKDLELNSLSINVNHLLNHYDREEVLSIFITDSDANLIHIKGDSLPYWIMPLLKEQMNKSQNVNDWNDCWYSLVNSRDENDIEGGMVFIMAIPILNDLNNTNQPNKQITGLVVYLVSFDNLIDKFISPLKLSKNDFAWILDGNGRLIFHPNHEEMLLRNTKAINPDCISCHSSFEVQNKCYMAKDLLLNILSVLNQLK